MNRAELEAHVAHVKERFRARVASVKWWHRNEIAAAAKAMAMQLEAVDYGEADGIRKLAELLFVPHEERDPPAPGPPSSRKPPSFDRYSLPPDKEGDEELLARMKRSRPARRGDGTP